MGGNGLSNQLTVKRALEIARNGEDRALDPAVSVVLERAISEIWQRIQAHPDTYVLSKDEFAVFNYFRGRFQHSDVARRAVGRFWDNFEGDASEIDGYRV
ncbi:hypothetical protein MMC16_000776 [Acarospora aff. strigata]|nr:hypothetical protein [Acarospora aff. strigata]